MGRRGALSAARGRRHAAPAAVALCLALGALLAGCATPGPAAGGTAAPVPYPAVRFAVISDPHLFDVSTSTPGPAFDAALGSGIKLHAESREILETALAGIAAERPAFLLVCGDLTRDGEKSGHELAARLLGGLAESGIPVLVVPGNHDVRNPRAARFEGDAAEPVDGVEPEEFAAIYAGLGYGRALERDPASLSYVAEPVRGLRVLALDGCRYRGETGRPITDGRLSRETLAWAGRALARARSDGAAVIVFLHHAVVPHFTDMKKWLDPYLLDGHAGAARLLAGAEARLVFTGHGHAQDITRGETPAGPVWDVETGSLVSWPNPWRMVEIDDGGTVRITSRRVTSIPSRPGTFAAWSQLRFAEGLQDYALSIVRRYGVAGAPAAAIARRGVEAFAAFYAGDEPGPVGPVDRSALGPWSCLVAAVVRGFLDDLGTDLAPADNDVTFRVP